MHRFARSICLRQSLHLQISLASTSRWRVANNTASGGVDAGSWNRGFDFQSEVCIRLVRLVVSQVPPVRCDLWTRHALHAHDFRVPGSPCTWAAAVCPLILRKLTILRPSLHKDHMQLLKFTLSCLDVLQIRPMSSSLLDDNC